MPVTVYKSTDAGAPVLTGIAGSLCTVLDAVLVNGYGALAAAGWAIPFTGANKRIYRPPTGQLRGYLRVQDDAPRAAPFADGREARVLASEAATAVDTQTGKYPTTPVTGIVMRKSLTADATARPWIAVADARTLYFFAQTGDFGSGWASFCAGEYFSVKSTADAYNGMIVGSIVEQLAATSFAVAANENLAKLCPITGTVAVATVPGSFTPRPFVDTANVPVTSTPIGRHGSAAHSAAVLAGLMAYPNPPDAIPYQAQVWVHEGLNLPIIRGRMRGFWHCLHPVGAAIKHGDTWAGAGSQAGKTFMAIKPTPAADGIFVIEISDTWETN